MDIIDSLTKQIIHQGEDITLMMLVNSRSEDNSVCLLTRPADQYKLASLPIKAFWSGYGFEVRDEDQFAIKSFLASVGQEGKSFASAISMLWNHGKMDVEKPYWNCSNMREFSVFAIKHSTLQKLSEIKVVTQNVPILDGESHLSVAREYLAPLLEVERQILACKAGDPVLRDLYDQENHLKRMVYLRNDHGYDEDYEGKIPYGAYALSDNNSFFCHPLKKVLRSTSFQDDSVYAEFYLGAHLAMSIKHAMSYLDLPFSPTFHAQSPVRETGKIEFMSKVLMEELDSYCHEAKDYEDHPSEKINMLISPIKSKIAELLKLQQRLEILAHKCSD